MSDDIVHPRDTRVLGQHLEIIHAVVYFAPGVDQALREVGLQGFWMGYFGSRAAAMGPVGAAVVKATFYNFHPAMVDRAIPDAWAYASPAAILAARHEAAGRVLRSHWRAVDPQVIETAAALSVRAAVAIVGEGRPLAAAHRALPIPTAAVDRLFWAATALREHRGDAHVALLVAHGIDGCEAHGLASGTDRVPKEMLQRARGWSDEDWNAACERLAQRGLVEVSGRATARGTELRASIEAQTDARAAPPYAALSGVERVALRRALAVLSSAVAEGEQLPFPNPIGVDRPAPGGP